MQDIGKYQVGSIHRKAHSFRFFIDKLDCNDIRQTLTKGEATKYLVTPVAISLGVAGKGVYFSFPDLTALRDTLQQQDQENDIYVPLARLKKTVNKNNVNKLKETFKEQIIQLWLRAEKEVIKANHYRKYHNRS